MADTMADHMKAHDHKKSAHPDKKSAHEHHLKTGYSTPTSGYHEEAGYKPAPSASHSNRQPNRG